MVDIAGLARLGGVRKYSKDEVFFSCGDPGYEMFIILKGEVGVFINSENETMPIAKLKDGDIFGEMSLLEGLPRSATIIALKDTICLVINDSNFEQIISQQPNLAFRIMKSLSSRLRQQNEELASLKRNPQTDKKDSFIVAASASASFSPSDDIYPPGHKSYPLIAPATHANYLFDGETLCPVCGNKFQVKMVRSSRLRLEKIDYDLRQHFLEFDPLWYTAWVCPHCYYANLYLDFKHVSDTVKKKILDQKDNPKTKIEVNFSVPRRINEVFTAYYLILKNLKEENLDPIKTAKIWLRLSWLYSDVKDEEMYIYTSQQALHAYQESYYNSHHNTSAEQDQHLTLLLGELCLRLNQREEALKHFRNSIVHKNGNKNLNRQAEARIQELHNF
jgi:uncharacterized protein (DUF2225 family)